MLETFGISPIGAIITAVTLWWMLTGSVFFLCRQDQKAFPLIFIGGLMAFGAAFAGLEWASERTDTAAVYCAFSSALVLWSFQELTFYLGYITGPRTIPCHDGCSGWRHFGHALQASLYHEILIMMTFGLIALLTWNAPNKLGLVTFGLIWVMHESARINVFLGVRNVQADWVPDHLMVLKSFLKEAPCNSFFFPSAGVIAAAFSLVLLAALDASPASPDAVSLTLITSLIGLGLLEHICLVAPLPLGPLWRLFGAPGPSVPAQSSARS